mgnify:CR=1 FL=1
MRRHIVQWQCAHHLLGRSTTNRTAPQKHPPATARYPVVEPVAAILGAAAVLAAKPLLPYAMAFAAGAMLFVVVEEVIPESQRNGNTDLATGGTMLGFLVMMILDVALG